MTLFGFSVLVGFALNRVEFPNEFGTNYALAGFFGLLLSLLLALGRQGALAAVFAGVFFAVFKFLGSKGSFEKQLYFMALVYTFTIPLACLSLLFSFAFSEIQYTVAVGTLEFGIFALFYFPLKAAHRLSVFTTLSAIVVSLFILGLAAYAVSKWVIVAG